MKNVEFIEEVVESFRAGRRRFVLASVTTVFGIFLLVLLVGAGLSVTRGISSMYVTAEKKSVTINAGKTSLLYQGRGKDVPVMLNENDVRNLSVRFSDKINHILPIMKRMVSVSVGGKVGHFRSYGVWSGYMNTDFFHVDLYSGRDITISDVSMGNKVCLISDIMAQRYFGDGDPESAISQYIEVDGIYFQIIGLFKGWRSDIDTNFIIFPSSTVASLWKMEDKYNTIELDINVNAPDLQTEEEEASFRDTLRKLIAQEHSFDYRDKSALIMTDIFAGYRQVSSILGGMRMTILLFCILILVSGIFGVSNILFISVRERTYEIVLRRLMGASDAHIFSLIVCESVLIMFLSSLVGILLAKGALHILDSIVTDVLSGDRGIWGSFDVDFSILVAVVLSTIISGIFAGLAPAKKAMSLKITEVY